MNAPKKTQDSFVRKLKAKYQYQAGPKENLDWFENNLDSTYFQGKWTAKNLKSNKTLFTINGASFGQQDFARYLEKNYRSLKKMVQKLLWHLNIKTGRRPQF